MKQYEKMKDSGVEGIGLIPEHWYSSDLKWVCKKLVVGFVGSSEQFYTDESGIPMLSTTNIKNGKMDLTNLKYVTRYFHDKNRKSQLMENDLIVARHGESGSTALIEKLKEANCLNVVIVRLDTNKIIPKYLQFMMNSDVIKIQLAYEKFGGVQGVVNTEDIGNVKIVFPNNLDEQKQISTFLIHITSKIDSEIQKNQKLIEIIKEKIQVTINQVVSKGLDLTISSKDSGVEWIGEIPEHWNVIKIKYSSFVKGRVGWQGLRSEEFIDDGPYLITGTDFEDGKINWKKCYHVEQWRYDQDPYIQIRNDDLLITKDGTIGKLAYIDNLPGPATLNSHLLVIRSIRNEFMTRFLYWIFRGDYFTRYVNLIRTGTTFYGISQESIEDFAFALPKIGEQKMISDFLDEKILSLNNLIGKIELQIKKLQEFRQSLISSTITGKIDVHNFSN